MTKNNKSADKPGRREDFEETRMTLLNTYVAKKDHELRVHDAEFKGKHYLDFRFYEKRSRGIIPTKRGIRISPRDVAMLEDAIVRWKEYFEHVENGNDQTQETQS